MAALAELLDEALHLALQWGGEVLVHFPHFILKGRQGLGDNVIGGTENRNIFLDGGDLAFGLCRIPFGCFNQLGELGDFPFVKVDPALGQFLVGFPLVLDPGNFLSCLHIFGNDFPCFLDFLLHGGLVLGLEGGSRHQCGQTIEDFLIHKYFGGYC